MLRAPDSTRDRYLGPAQVAAEAARELALYAPAPLVPSVAALLIPRTLGEAVSIPSPDEPDEQITVTLSALADVSLAVGNRDLLLDQAEFGARLLAPATMAIAEQIRHQLTAAGCGAGYVSAPLVAPPGVHAAHATIDGLSLRALFQHDTCHNQLVLSLHVLYAVVPPPQLPLTT